MPSQEKRRNRRESHEIRSAAPPIAHDFGTFSRSSGQSNAKKAAKGFQRKGHHVAGTMDHAGSVMQPDLLRGPSPAGPIREMVKGLVQDKRTSVDQLSQSWNVAPAKPAVHTLSKSSMIVEGVRTPGANALDLDEDGFEGGIQQIRSAPTLARSSVSRMDLEIDQNLRKNSTAIMKEVESMMVGKQLLRDMALKELRHRLREKNDLLEAHRSRIRILEFELEKHNIPLPGEFAEARGDGAAFSSPEPEGGAAVAKDPDAELMLENSILKQQLRQAEERSNLQKEEHQSALRETLAKTQIVKPEERQASLREMYKKQTTALALRSPTNTSPNLSGQPSRSATLDPTCRTNPLDGHQASDSDDDGGRKASVRNNPPSTEPSVGSMERTEYHELLAKLSQLEAELEVAKANAKVQQESPPRTHVDSAALSFAIKQLADEMEQVDFGVASGSGNAVPLNLARVSADVKDRVQNRASRRSSLTVPSGTKSLFADRKTNRASRDSSGMSSAAVGHGDQQNFLFPSRLTSHSDLSNMAAADSPSGVGQFFRPSANESVDMNAIADSINYTNMDGPFALSPATTDLYSADQSRRTGVSVGQLPGSSEFGDYADGMPQISSPQPSFLLEDSQQADKRTEEVEETPVPLPPDIWNQSF